MKLHSPVLFAFFAILAVGQTPPSPDVYKLGPDSERQPNVPQGKVTKHTWVSKIYPGSTRDYWVYVPSQYKGDKPACLMIFQDGGGLVAETGRWRAPIVLDNLIHKGEMPVTIGIFINPGILPALNESQEARYNRSFEYDALGDRYARFLIEEIIPEIGKQYKLSADPNDRALAGSSSGGIAAFTAAWERPDAFRRVLSFIGSYTNLRGGHIYAGLIRKTEPKPLRIFLQDGNRDQNIYSGNWWIANQDVASSLEYAGYDAKFVTGTEGHNGNHGSAILPDALRWLWREYPKPITRSTKGGERHHVTMMLDPGQGWELVSEGHRFTEGPAVDKDGTLYFTDLPASRIHKVTPDGKSSVFKEDSGGANGLMFGPDGRLYACQNGRKRIVAYDKSGAEAVIAEDVNSNDLVVTAKGEIYFTEPSTKKVWFIDAKGAKRVVHEAAGLEFPNGVMLSPDQSLLTVTDFRSKWVWSFQVQPDGGLAHGQPFYRMEAPDDTGAALPDGLTMDTEGYLYVATSMGVQICDQAGRVVAILNKPQGARLVANLTFGGPDMKTLYITAVDKVYKRRLRQTGASNLVPVKPPRPRL